MRPATTFVPKRAWPSGPVGTLDGMKSQREKADEKREEKLAQIKDQVDDGSLTIRKMTDKERADHPPRPRTERPRRR